MEVISGSAHLTEQLRREPPRDRFRYARSQSRFRRIIRREAENRCDRTEAAASNDGWRIRHPRCVASFCRVKASWTRVRAGRNGGGRDGR